MNQVIESLSYLPMREFIFDTAITFASSGTALSMVFGSYYFTIKYMIDKLMPEDSKISKNMVKLMSVSWLVYVFLKHGLAIQELGDNAERAWMNITEILFKESLELAKYALKIPHRHPMESALCSIQKLAGVLTESNEDNIVDKISNAFYGEIMSVFQKDKQTLTKGITYYSQEKLKKLISSDIEKLRKIEPIDIKKSVVSLQQPIEEQVGFFSSKKKQVGDFINSQLDSQCDILKNDFMSHKSATLSKIQRNVESTMIHYQQLNIPIYENNMMPIKDHFIYIFIVVLLFSFIARMFPNKKTMLAIEYPRSRSRRPNIYG